MEGLGRDFNRIWSAGLITNLADGVLKLAAPLLAVRLTRDPVLISLLAALSLLPWLFFAIPIGAFVDRVDKVKALVFGNLLRSCVAIGLSYAIYSGRISIWILLGTVFLIGICEVLVDTTSQAAIPHLISSTKLEKGNSRLQISEVTVSQFVGTPLSGFLYALAIGLPFLFSGVGFVFAATILGSRPFLSRMGSEKTVEIERPRLASEIKFAIDYMYKDKRIFHIVLITTSIGFFYSLSSAIAPLFMIQELGVAPRYLGVLFAVQGIGALLGSISAPRISEKLGRGRALALNLTIASLPIILTGIVPSVWYYLPLSVMIGFSISIWNILLMSLYQSLIPRELLGRIHGARRTIVWGLMPLGSVLGGFVAKGGLRLPFLIGGIAASAIVFFTFKRIVAIGNESVIAAQEL